MRASTLFALTLALLIGLGVAVAARWAGLLGKAPETPKKEKEIQILVAAKNLFPGDVIDASGVKTRALKPEETAHYEANKDKFLPAVPNAAALRVPTKPIEADSPILREQLAPMVRPDPLHQRLLSGMRAINVSVQKEQSAGGLIQVGEWVDVLLTSSISQEGGETLLRTATIAHRLRVIAKRNALWTVFAPLPDGKPVQFTLEANPYRSALIEFCREKGVLSIVPLSASEQRTLEEKRVSVLNGPTNGLQPVLFADPSLGEYDQEESRIEMINKGEYSIGNADMVRIFDLKTPPPPLAENKVEMFSGLQRTRVSRYGADGAFLGSVDEKRSVPAGISPTNINGFRFSKCPDGKCGKKKTN